MVEIAGEPITQAELVLTRQAIEQGHKPTDEIEAGFDDRQLCSGRGSGAGDVHGGHAKNKI
jgi:hypothetical protein